MIDPQSVPEIRKDEMLVRFVLSKSHLRANKTLKADAFLPYPHSELSVTRLINLSAEEIWSIGRNVEAARKKPLLGRGDIQTVTVLKARLQVIADPLQDNPNHANISAWPVNDKPAQKLIAQDLAAVATFVPVP